MWYEVHAIRQAGGGGRPLRTQRAGEGSTADVGAGHGEERTRNISFMVVTFDVSKLSGWLNADADCRVERRAYHAERGVWAGRREGVGRRQRTSGVHGERARLCEGWGAPRTSGPWL